MSTEREVKLSVPATFTLPDLSDLEGLVATPAEPRRYQTVYVDTEDLRLARWDCSLRHRQGEGWTLKFPATSEGVLVVRDELAFEGEARRVPPQASDLFRAYARGSELRPVARLRTLRRRVELSDAEGARLGEIVDDEVSVMDGARVAARFREVEVEVAVQADIPPPLFDAGDDAGPIACGGATCAAASPRRDRRPSARGRREPDRRHAEVPAGARRASIGAAGCCRP